MAAHVDIWAQQDRLSKPFWSSMALHLAVAAAAVAYGWTAAHRPNFGDKAGGGMGAVAVNPVATIPLPSRQAPPNPVANDTESHVPTPPPKPKVQRKIKPPEPDAIPLKSRTVPKKPSPVETSQPNKFREQQHELPNQVYSTPGQAVSNPMYQMPGAGGVGIGNNSPLGAQFGYYAKLIIDQVGRHWQTTQLNPRIQTAPAVVVMFVIQRDGSVPQNSIKISQSSGILPVDLSAERAVMDAGKFPQLPAGFSRNEAQIELRFELKR